MNRTDSLHFGMECGLFLCANRGYEILDEGGERLFKGLTGGSTWGMGQEEDKTSVFV